MTRLRPFAADDAPEVAALQASAFAEARGLPAAERAAYFRAALLGNPWVDPELPSWVAEDGGRIAGFLGVLPRRMRLGGRLLRVAVGCQFMAAPGGRGAVAALELMRRFLAGPQDLSLADGATHAARRLWEAAGGLSSPLHALHWLRLLRPARALLARRLPAAAPLGALADTWLAPPPGDKTLAEDKLDAASLLTALNETPGHAGLRPDYDAASLGWLLGELEAKTRHGPLQRCLLREPDGRIAGWFLYYLNGATSQVVQLGARPGRLKAAFQRLARHAWERGAAALEGRVEPRLADALGAMRCLLRSSGGAVLLHARDPALAAAFLRPDAFFTRLEGEWWMRFLGEDASRRSSSPASTAATWPAPERRSPAAAP